MITTQGVGASAAITIKLIKISYYNDCNYLPGEDGSRVTNIRHIAHLLNNEDYDGT